MVQLPRAPALAPPSGHCRACPVPTGPGSLGAYGGEGSFTSPGKTNTSWKYPAVMQCFPRERAHSQSALGFWGWKGKQWWGVELRPSRRSNSRPGYRLIKPLGPHGVLIAMSLWVMMPGQPTGKTFLFNWDLLLGNQLQSSVLLCQFSVPRRHKLLSPTACL